MVSQHVKMIGHGMYDDKCQPLDFYLPANIALVFHVPHCTALMGDHSKPIESLDLVEESIRWGRRHEKPLISNWHFTNTSDIYEAASEVSKDYAEEKIGVDRGWTHVPQLSSQPCRNKGALGIGHVSARSSGSQVPQEALRKCCAMHNLSAVVQELDAFITNTTHPSLNTRPMPIFGIGRISNSGNQGFLALQGMHPKTAKIVQ